MRKLLLLQLAVFISFTSIVGCGGWNQDPLADAKGLGKPQGKPDVQPEKPSLPADYILMDSALFKMVKEGEKIEVKVDARVILPDYTLSVEVRNLSQFAGATFDTATNTFEWTPQSGTANDDITEFSLEFVAVATKPGSVAVSRERVTKIGVTRTLLVPTIVEVSSLNPEIREGVTDQFTVKIEDRSAGNNPANYPSLIARNSSGLPSMAGFVEISAPTLDSPNNYSFTVEVNLSKAELTKSRSKLGFELLPVSKFQKAGPAQVVSYDVLNAPADVVSTWKTPITAAPGSKIDYQFLVMDPKDEGNVSLDSVISVPAGASLTCTANNWNSVLACKFVWQVPATAKGSFKATATFINASTDYYDKYNNDETLYLPISIGAPLGGN